MNDIKIIVFSFISSFLISLLAIPVIRKIGKKYKIIDIPNSRKLHQKPLVRIGGTAILVGYFTSIFIARNIFPDLEVFISSFRILNIIFISNLLVFILGFIDDIVSLSPFLRLTFQLIISSIIWGFGIKIASLNLSIFNTIPAIDLASWQSLVLTSLTIVGLMNAINWIDGLDGLAIGVTIFSLISFLLVGQANNSEIANLIIPCLLGGCFSFYIFNRYPAKIMMGDSGSNTLGLNLAITGIICTASNTLNNISINDNYSINPLIVFLILILPITDMAYVIFKRIVNRKSPFLPDRSHIHHRLIDKGFNPIQSVNIIYFFSFLNLILLISVIKKIIFLFFISVLGMTFLLLKIYFKNLKTI